MSSDQPQQKDGKKTVIYLSQLLASKIQQDKTVIRTFLDVVVERNKREVGWWTGIDEMAKNLYMVDNNNAGVPMKITIYHLSFSSVEDRFGYRELKVIGDAKEVTVKQSLATVHLQLTFILLDQRSGDLITVCSTGGKGRKTYVPSIIRFENGGVTLVPGKDRFGDKITAKQKLDVSTIVRSRLGHLLVLFTAASNKQAFLCSYTDKLELILCVKIDQHELLKRSLRSSDDQYISAFLDGFRLLGHMNKYAFFVFSRTQLLVIAIKWPKDWYTYKQLPPGPLRIRWVSLEPPEEDCAMSISGFMGTDLYSTFQCEDGTHVKRAPSESKDYRLCANCGTKETYKRKNKAGKRIANFKVCRMCKELGINRLLPREGMSQGCHYCSFECVKAHWNTHKSIHKQKKTVDLNK